MRKNWPRTLAYLSRFRNELQGRSGYKRYFKPSDPFYAIYNVSPETIAPVKVIWTTMGSSMEATVLGLSSLDGTITARPTVFKNTVIYVAMKSEDEAFYLTSLLNCTWANYLLRASNVRGGKSAFVTNVLDNIAIPEFNRRNAVARELADIGRRATADANSGDDERLAVTEVMLDDASARFWSIGQRQQTAIHAALDVLR